MIKMSEQSSRLKYKKFRLENIDTRFNYINNEGIESFIYNFSSETLSKVYRLIIFSSELPPYDNKSYYNVQVNIEHEAEKRKFDCFSHIKDNKSDIFGVVYVDNKIVLID